MNTDWNENENISDHTRVWLAGIAMSIKYEEQRQITAFYVGVISGALTLTCATDIWSLQSYFVWPVLTLINSATCTYYVAQWLRLQRRLKAMRAYYDIACEGAALKASGGLTEDQVDRICDQSEAARRDILGGEHNEDKTNE